MVFFQDVMNYLHTPYIYHFDRLCDVDENGFARYCQKRWEKSVVIAKRWSKDLSTEWACRSYMAVKMIHASQMMFKVLTYSEQKNILMTRQYLLYYALLCAARALLFASINTKWSKTQMTMREKTHNSIIEDSCNELKGISMEKAEQVAAFLNEAKDLRELFSYAFPARGLNDAGPLLDADKTAEIAGLFCELAEANTQMLYCAWEKHSKKKILPNRHDLKELYQYDRGSQFEDREDKYRVSWFVRKYTCPMPLSWVAKDGMIEDFDGAWYCRDEENEGQDVFNPDRPGDYKIFQFG